MIQPWLHFKQGVRKNFYPVAFLFLLTVGFIGLLYLLKINHHSFAKEQQLLFLKGFFGGLYNNHYSVGIPAFFTLFSKATFFLEYLSLLPILCLWIGACGVYVLLHYGENVSLWIAAVSAGVWLLFPFWQYLDASMDFTLLPFFAVIPWLIFATIYLKFHYTIWAFACFCLSLTALFRVCDPQVIWLSLVAMFSILFFLFWEYFHHREFFSYAKFFLLIVCGTLLSIFAASESLFTFSRLFGELTYANDFILHFDQFIHFFHVPAILPAIFSILIFAAIGVRKHLFYTLFFLFFLVFPFIAKFLPGMWLLKNPFLSFGISFTFAFILFGIGLERVLMMRKIAWIEKRRSYFIYLLLSIVLFFSLSLRFGNSRSIFIFVLFHFFSIFAFLVLLSYRRFFKNHSLFLLIIFTVLLADNFVSGCYHRSKYPPLATDFYSSVDASMEQKNLQDYRIYPLEGLFYDNRFGEKYETIGGTFAYALRDFRSIAENCLEFELSSDLPINWNVVDMFAVRYVLRKDAPIKVDELKYIDYDTKTKISIYENRNYRGKLWFVEDAIQMENESSIYRVVNSMDFDPFSIAIVDQPLPDRVVKPEKYSAKIVEDNKDKITLRIYTDSPSFVVFSNSFSKDWYAFDQDDGVKIYKVNGILQGFYLQPGLHNISLEYIPVLERLASKVSLFFLLIEFALLFIGFFFYLKINYAGKTVYILK